MKVQMKPFILTLCIIATFLVQQTRQHHQESDENISEIQEGGTDFYQLNIVTGQYAYNVSKMTAALGRQFYANVLCGSFDHPFEMENIFRSLLSRISSSIMVNNYFKNVIEAKEVDEAENFSKEAKNQFLLMDIKDTELEFCLNNERIRPLENDIRVKFSHHVMNALLSMNSIMYQIKENVQNSEDNDTLGIESTCIMISSRLLNELEMFLKIISEQEFQISEPDLKVVELIQKLLQHLESFMAKKPVNFEKKEKIVHPREATILTKFLQPILLESEGKEMESPAKSIIEISKTIKESSRLVHNMLTQLHNDMKYSQFWDSPDTYLNYSLDNIGLIVSALNNFHRVITSSEPFTDKHEKRVKNDLLKINENYNDFLDLHSNPVEEMDLKEEEIAARLLVEDLSKAIKTISDITAEILESLKTLTETYNDYSVESVKRFIVFTANVTSQLFNAAGPLDHTIFKDITEIRSNVKYLQSVLSDFIPREEQRRGLYEARILAGHYAFEISNLTARLGQKFYSSSLCGSIYHPSEFIKSFHSILAGINNSTEIIDNYQLSLATDIVAYAKYVSERAIKAFPSFEVIDGEEVELCTNVTMTHPENDMMIELSHQMMTALLNAESIVNETNENVQSYMGMNDDTLYFETISMGILSSILKEFRIFLKSVEDKEFQITETDLGVVKLISDILQFCRAQ